MADDKTVAKVRRKLEATSEIPRLEKTTGRDGRPRPATTKGKSRAPSQKAGGIAGRTVTAEVDPAASAERRKQEYTADESEREAMTAKDAALREFDGHVLRLAQIINRAEPERFARTSVDVDKLLQLSRFLAEVAGQQPQAPTVIPLRDREQPTKEANPARSARRRPEIGRGQIKFSK